MKQIAFLFLYTMLLSSCSCLKKGVNNNNEIILTESNLTLLNGKYERKSVQLSKDSLPKGDLYWNFYANSYSHIFGNDKDLNLKNDTAFFELKVIDKNKISVLYMNGNDTIKCEIAKGKIKNGYFEFKRKYLFFSIIFANLYRDSKFRIKLSPDNDLITDYKEISFGTFFIIIPFYDKEIEYNVTFKRIEDIIKQNQK